jgi:hypothetical protein
MPVRSGEEGPGEQDGRGEEEAATPMQERTAFRHSRS